MQHFKSKPDLLSTGTSQGIRFMNFEAYRLVTHFGDSHCQLQSPHLLFRLVTFEVGALAFGWNLACQYFYPLFFFTFHKARATWHSFADNPGKRQRQSKMQTFY